MDSSRKLNLRVVAPLLIFNFLINFKPSEPFLTQYLKNVKRLTDHELATQVWPWSTFGAFALLLPFGLLAEIFGCRPIIFLGVLGRETTRVLLIFGQGIPTMQAMQFTYSAGVAAQTIFFAYVFMVSQPAQYAQLTSYVLASYHAGNVVAALVGELCVTLLPSWREDQTPLFYFSWLTSSLGLLCFALLPPPVRQPPPSLASHLWVHGPRSTLGKVASLWASFESQRWLAWYVCIAHGKPMHV